jgi:hypothetical protein
MSIQRIIEIPLQDIQSVNYETNIELYGDDSNSCICCGKRIKNYPKCRFLHLLTNGNIVSYSGDDIEDSQGFFPIGNDCAKKLVIQFTF